jgi:hypothetical protein
VGNGAGLSTLFPQYDLVFRALVGQASRLSLWTGKMPVPYAGMTGAKGATLACGLRSGASWSGT